MKTPTQKIKPLRLGDTSRGHQMEPCRSIVQEEISRAAFAPGLPPQPLVDHATKPAAGCPLPWWFCGCEVALFPPWGIPSHSTSLPHTRGQG